MTEVQSTVLQLHAHLQQFLDHVKDKLKFGANGKLEIGTDQFMLLLQYYAKSTLLDQHQPVEDDDWDYISLGILLKRIMASTADNAN